LLDRLLEIIGDRKIFVRIKGSVGLKTLAILIYQAGISYRKVRDLVGYLESFSHEALRKLYIKLRRLFVQERKYRRAVDETKVKLRESMGLCLECYRTMV